MKKPVLSFWQIWNMSFGFLGIQFGFALQNANVSRIFQTLGASIDDIPILWIAAPLTGLIVQPIVGYFSDRTWNRLGRRRPYFLVGAIAATIALIFMPNSPSLWIAAGMLWIMDASINISMEPFRAFVGDNLPDEQRTAGFAMQSFFIGVGAVIASLLPTILTDGFGFSNTADAGQIPASVKWSFYIGAGVFLLAVLWTVVKSFEYSPNQLRAFEGRKEEDTNTVEVQTITPLPMNRYIRAALPVLLLGVGITLLILFLDLKKELYVIGGGLAVFGILLLLAALLQRQNRNDNAFSNMLRDILQMPASMKQLAWVQFFSWFALFAMWIYTTSAVTSALYGTSDTTSEAYNRGANWVSTCFAIYNGVAACVAFLLPVIARKTSRKTTHIIALVAGALGLMSIMLFKDPNMLILSMIGIGIAWASILSMPYAILTGSLPAEKMGYYMGVFNFFIVIPQILAASILGFVINQWFANEAIWAMLLGGLSFLIAAMLTLKVKDEGRPDEGLITE